MERLRNKYRRIEGGIRKNYARRNAKNEKNEEKDNEKNLIKTMVLDPIERDIELVYFVRLLSNIDSDDKIIAVNGKWGSGKTFFLKQFQLLCNYYADKIENKTEIVEYIKKYEMNMRKEKLNFFKLLQQECEEFVNEECCEVLYFNAWEYDSNDDPIKSLMYFLIENYNLDLKKIKVDWKELGKKAIKFLFGIEYGENCLDKVNLFEDIIGNNDIKKIWTTLLDELIIENCNKLYIIIDDLDRCRPEYTVKMFERLQHFANDERVVFILAIDYEEVLCMIEHFYGYRDSGNRFLEKIIDHFIDLENRYYEDYSKYLGNFVVCQRVKDGYPAIANIVRNITKCVFEDFHMTLREMARYSETIEYISSFYDDYAERFAGGLGNTILKGIVMPYALGLNITSKKEYYKFIRGEGQIKFVDFVERHEELLADIGIKKQNFKNDFIEIYQFIVCVMRRDKDFIESKDIDNIRLYEDTVSYVFQCINCLHNFEKNCGDE